MIFFSFFSILNMTFTTLLHVFELHDHWSFLLLYQNCILDIKSPLPSFKISLDAWIHENEPFMKVFFFCLNSMNFVSMIVQRTFCADDTFVSIDQKKIKNFVELFIANATRIRLFFRREHFQYESPIQRSWLISFTQVFNQFRTFEFGCWQSQIAGAKGQW